MSGTARCLVSCWRMAMPPRGGQEITLCLGAGIARRFASITKEQQQQALDETRRAG